VTVRPGARGGASWYDVGAMSTLIPENAQTFRKVRIAALAVAYFLPTIVFLVRFGGERFSIGALFEPTLRRGIIVGAIAFQAYQLQKPRHLDPRTVVIFRSDLNVEIIGIVFGFVLQLALYGGTWAGVPLSAMWLFYLVFDTISLALMFAFRTSVVIDGTAQTFTVWGFIPKTLPFSAVQGLGTVQVEYRRNGAYAGTAYFVALFPGTGAPIRLRQELDPNGVAARIQQLNAYTGAPIAAASPIPQPFPFR
jgi:hypothetical protein